MDGTKKTPKAKREKYVNEKDSFICVSDFQDYVRNNGTPDYCVINKVLFTMEEYDNDGKEIVYANIRNGLNIFVNTKNRYDKEVKFSDARVTLETLSSTRNGFPYVD